MNSNYEDLTKNFFNNLNKSNIHLVSDFYAEDVKFYDPVGEISGLKNLIAYYQEMYQNVISISFDFHHFNISGDTLFATWTMNLHVSKLNSSKPYQVKGVSHITFNSQAQAIYHRDYFDMGDFIYERIPVLKSIIGFVKDRLKHQ